jgi:hypothetical protein
MGQIAAQVRGRIWPRCGAPLTLRSRGRHNLLKYLHKP